MKIAVPNLLACILLYLVAPAYASVTNPMILPNSSGGVKGPSMMKYRGHYYLYSTSAASEDMEVWKSEDLTSWSFEGYCTQSSDRVYMGTPKVMHHNGEFYMYATTPDLNHPNQRNFVFAWKSSNPLGPFVRASISKVSSDIDGFVFTDNDGKWYMFNGDHNGIQYGEMASPVSKPNSWNLLSNCNINIPGTYRPNWNEAPYVWNGDDGRYYLNWNGNSHDEDTYQIHTASGNTLDSMSSDGVSVQRSNLSDNPSWPWVAPGVGCFVRSPNLKDLHAIYHVRKQGKLSKEVHLAQAEISGGTLDIEGPYEILATSPSMPTFYNYFDDTAKYNNDFTAINGSSYWNLQTNSNWVVALSSDAGHRYLLCDSTTSNDYVVEAWLEQRIDYSGGGSFYGLVVSSDTSANNLVEFVLHRGTSDMLRIRTKTNGNYSGFTDVNLPSGYDLYRNWVKLRIQKSGDTFTVRFGSNGNGLKLIDYNAPGYGSGQVGMIVKRAKARFGWLAWSNQ